MLSLLTPAACYLLTTQRTNPLCCSKPALMGLVLPWQHWTEVVLLPLVNGLHYQKASRAHVKVYISLSKFFQVWHIVSPSKSLAVEFHIIKLTEMLQFKVITWTLCSRATFGHNSLMGDSGGFNNLIHKCLPIVLIYSYDRKRAVRQSPNMGACLQAKQTGVRGFTGSGWLLVTSFYWKLCES